MAENKPAVKETESAALRTLRTEIELLRNKLQRHRTGQELIAEIVRDVYREPPDLWLPKRPVVDPRKSAPVEHAVLHCSDTQIGKTTASYNCEVAARRLMALAEKVIRITETRRSYAKVDVIHVLLGGDMVEGEDVFPSQAHQIDVGVFDQAVRSAPSALCKMLLRLAEYFPHVSVSCVPGNHGRNGGKHTRSNPRTNWDNVCYDVLKLMLESGKVSEFLRNRIRFQASETFYAIERVFGWGLLMVHGDQITGGFAGFPWYGAAKRAWGWIDSIPAPWDYLLFGHFHTYAEAVLNHRTFMANGTTESDNDYARASLSAAGFPCQRLCFFTASHGRVSDHQVFLSEDRYPQSAKVYNGSAYSPVQGWRRNPVPHG